jgi:hypothetical protein
VIPNDYARVLEAQKKEKRNRELVDLQTLKTTRANRGRSAGIGQIGT